MPKMNRILSYSGGKDSTAMYLRAIELGRPFRAVFCDTGNEHEATYDYIRDLSDWTHGPKIEWVKADFSSTIERKRETVTNKWPGDGIPQTQIDRALELLQPTGNPFLDLCLAKGRFPSTQARFCTSELKVRPLHEQVFMPIQGRGEIVISWQGVRADESKARAKMHWHDFLGGGLFNFRPILRWSVNDVFEIHRRHGIEPNPLYRMGFGRVGCMPCIMARKAEIKSMADRFPEHVERIAEWELLVGATAKRGTKISSFFAYDKTPGDHQTDYSMDSPNIKKVVEWSRTSDGGRQFQFEIDEENECSSLYGLCE